MRGLLLFLFTLLAISEAASVIGIDFGSSNIKIGIIRGGQRDTVLNKEGKRKVAALAGLNKHGDRVFSAAAESLLKAYPTLVQRYTKHLLGRRPDHPWIVKNKDFFTTPVLADSRGTAALPMGTNNSVVPALEIVSWLFKEAREAARHHARASVVSAVIAVPPFFTQWERAALLQAAKMAGLEVLSLVNEGTAVAIDYFVSRTIGDEPKLVMLYDMGDVSTKVTLVRFDKEKSEKPGGKDTPQATVLDVAWDDSLGGRNFDENLAQHFLALATKQSKLNVGANARAVEKLRAEAQKVKEILSANTEYEANLEGLIEEFNFASKVSRTEFERLNAPLFTELLEPIKALLENNKLTIANISEIQMLGGGSRVPKVREAIASFFQRPNVDTHLNGDEAICSGATFYAAMKSPAFKKQNFKFRDLTLFPVSMSHPSLGSEPAGDAKLLFGFQNKLFSKKVVSFTTDQPVWMRLKYEIDAGPRRLPAGTPRELVKVELNAVDLTGYNVTEKKTPKISIAYRLTSSGTVEVESAETDVEVWELPPPPPPPKKAKKTTPAPSINGTDANSTNTTTEEPTPAPVIEYIRVNKTVPITWKETWLGIREYSADELAKIVAHTTALEDAENDKVMRAEAINELEGFVYATRDRLTDDDLERHATEKEREDIKVALTSASDFLEGAEVESSGSKAIRLKLTELKEMWRPLERRIKLFKELPGSITKCRDGLKVAERSLDNITVARMVNDTEVAAALEKINATRVFLDESEKKVRSAPENADPPVIPTDIQLRCDVTKGFVKRLHSAPKRTTTKQTTTTTGGSSTESPEETKDKQDL